MRISIFRSLRRFICEPVLVVDTADASISEMSVHLRVSRNNSEGDANVSFLIIGIHFSLFCKN